MKRVNASDVWNLRVTYRAQAKCDGISDDAREIPCPWTPFYPRDDRDVRRQAREHILRNPEHEVLVEVVDATRYYVSKSTLARLSAPADGDDQPVDPVNPQED